MDRKRTGVCSVAPLLLLAACVFVIGLATGSSSGSVRTVPVVPLAAVQRAGIVKSSDPRDSAAAPSRPGQPAPVSQKTLPPPPVAKPAGRVWCVVVGNFSSRSNAAHQAELIARRWPQFSTSVFPASASNNLFLVTIGAGFSAETAKWWRERAIASGLPRETYVAKCPSLRP